MDLPVCVRAGAGAAAVQVLRAVHCGLVEGDRGGYRGRDDASVGQQRAVDERVWRGVDGGGCAAVRSRRRRRSDQQNRVVKHNVKKL